jgi:hypothetical protein
MFVKIVDILGNVIGAVTLRLFILGFRFQKKQK